MLRQPKVSTSAPPAAGPTMGARLDVASQAPIARSAAARLGERVRQQRERRWQDHCCAEALEDPSGHEDGQARCDAAQRRRDPERRESEHVHGPVTHAIADDSRRQHEAREHQRVAVQDPLQAGDRAVQVATDVRERDVDDVDVEQRHDEAEAHRCERPGLVASPAVVAKCAAHQVGAPSAVGRGVRVYHPGRADVPSRCAINRWPPTRARRRRWRRSPDARWRRCCPRAGSARSRRRPWRRRARRDRS